MKGLAQAEGLLNGQGRWKPWGVVALAANPSTHTELLYAIVKSWPQYFHAQQRDGNDVAAKYGKLRETLPFDENGLLRNCSGRYFEGACADIPDIVIPVVTAPTPINGLWPTPREIASAAVTRANDAPYFRSNVLSGIRTADDRDIWDAILALQPPWAATQQYAALARGFQDRGTNMANGSRRTIDPGALAGAVIAVVIASIGPPGPYQPFSLAISVTLFVFLLSYEFGAARTMWQRVAFSLVCGLCAVPGAGFLLESWNLDVLHETPRLLPHDGGADSTVRQWGTFTVWIVVAIVMFMIERITSRDGPTRQTPGDDGAGQQSA